MFIAIPFLCFSQEKAKTPKVTKNKANIIQSVEFPDSIQASQITPSASVFFKDSLKTTGNDHFRKVPHKEKKQGFAHEHFDQYYKGVKVEGAGYNFHYKNGKMFYAHGN